MFESSAAPPLHQRTMIGGLGHDTTSARVVKPEICPASARSECLSEKLPILPPNAPRQVWRDGTLQQLSDEKHKLST
jgi:hypothetical protein